MASKRYAPTTEHTVEMLQVGSAHSSWHISQLARSTPPNGTSVTGCVAKDVRIDRALLTVQPPRECLWNGAGNGIVSVSTTSCHADQWARLHSVRCTVVELAAWDRRTDGQADGSQHCLVHSYQRWVNIIVQSYRPADPHHAAAH